jgi:hypothetical protein
MSRRRPAARSAGRAAAGDHGHGDLAASLVLIFPLLLAYELGVLISAQVNGADLVSRGLFALCGHARGPYLLVNAIIALGFLAWIRRTGRWSTLQLAVVAPVFLEAALYALSLGVVASLVVDRLLGLGVGLPSVIGALGAGVHEELVFRLGLVGGAIALATRRDLDRRWVVPAALAGGALLFAAAHHLGAGAAPWTAHAVAFRTVAGLAFGAIWWWRSLAHAVYAHVLYDLLVAATA